jgi:hypothetical protein
MGVRYLWIDALCIVQDSADDWEQESKRMGSVYRNSKFTISALTSPSGTHGILTRTKNSPSPMPSTVRVYSNPELEGTVEVFRGDLSEEDLSLLDNKAPLESRAWTLQEKVLSPRVLFYGTKQTYWKCSQALECVEGLPPGLRTPEDAYLPILSPVLHHQADGPLGPVDTEMLLAEYYSLARSYSGRQLTKKADKLPAFSGLVEAMHRILGGSYLAGLWSSDFNRGLLWYAEMRSCAHVQTYRVPSWSWAVTDEPLIFGDAPSRCELQLNLISSSIVLRNPEVPYGEVISGHVIVEGLTRPLARASTSVGSFNNPAAKQFGLCLYDELESKNAEVSRSYCPCYEINDYLVSLIDPYDGEATSANSDSRAVLTEYLCLFVDLMGSNERLEGIILRSVRNSPGDAYERAGHFIAQVDLSEIRKWTSRTLKLV